MNTKECVIGLELGSTRIKAVLVNKTFDVVASGSYTWENKFCDGIWTYDIKDAIEGIQSCYQDLKNDVKNKYNQEITEVAGIGISGMMHGYLPFDKDYKQLTEFRTWRNTITSKAAEVLTELFDFNIPQRWSIAHLYQAILNKETHLKDLAHITTLAGYIHYLLTGENVLGIDEASGVFPIDSKINDYSQEMLDKFDGLLNNEYSFKIRDVLPKVKVAGQDAGHLTKDGALLLDPSGLLKEGIPFCPPEGDAATGMVATNSIRVKTGNVSAGTSDFAMVVIDKQLKLHREIDMVTTPSGKPVAMIHCNNCTGDINAWANLFKEFASEMNLDLDMGDVFTKLYSISLKGNKDSGLLAYNYLSGEGVTDLNEGRPILIRTPDSKFTLANLMKTNMFSSLATLKIGLDILIKEEKVEIERIYGHGGFFKTPVAGQSFLSAAIDAPVSLMSTAGEGGPYGMALLASYLVNKDKDETLEDYLDKKVFKDAKTTTLKADEELVNEFNEFIDKYKKALDVERKAIECLEV